MSAFNKIQDLNFSPFYFDNCLKQLENLKKLIENVQGEYTKLFDYIKINMLSSDIINFFNKNINKYISWIDTIKTKENYKKDFTRKI